MTLKKAVQETKHFIEIEAEQVGVKPEDIIEELKDEFETKEFVEATKGA